MTTACATRIRPARISLIADPGVFANVYDGWGTCGQVLPFEFNEDWREYNFGAAYYDDPKQGCTGIPTATISVSYD